MQQLREIFERFARGKGSDPMDSQFWYSLNPKELRKVNVCTRVSSLLLFYFVYAIILF